MGKKLIWVALGLLLCLACEQGSGDPLAQALASEDPKIKRVMDSLAAYEVQIRYTQIDHQADSIVFTDFDFQVATDTYFYPASTVKFPAAVAALEKLNEVDSLHRGTRFYIEGDSIETTFAKAITEIFAVSDNAANNRLIEFLGQDGLNARMAARGVAPIRIAHRLSTSNADDRTTKPLIIYSNDSTTSTSVPILNQELRPLDLQQITKGIGYYAGDSLIREAFDFSLKNYYPIQAQHQLLKKVLFPEAFAQNERFAISEEQREFLLSAMSTLPKDVGYDRNEYYDSYVKFFMYGDTTEPMPETVKIYNKVGYAYGTLTDCAYIVDEENGIAFMVTATILVNKDGIINDDNYEYDSVGIPFLAQLGRELYAIEKNRTR